MSNATTIKSLYDGGYIEQADRLCKHESISTVVGELKTEYRFADGSSIERSRGSMLAIPSPYEMLLDEYEQPGCL